MSVVLLLAAVAAYFGPGVASVLLGGSLPAWTYVFDGAEAAFLWALVFVAGRSLLVRSVAAWGVMEAMQRPVCRLAFPMDQKPMVPDGQSLCDAAFGVPMSLLSVFIALLLAAVVQEVQRVRTARG